MSEISLLSHQNALNKGLAKNDAGVLALLHLIAQFEDSDLCHHGGQEDAHWAAQTLKTFLRDNPNPTVKQLKVLDNAFISRSLSPGACADLLAVTYFFDVHILYTALRKGCITKHIPRVLFLEVGQASSSAGLHTAGNGDNVLHCKLDNLYFGRFKLLHFSVLLPINFIMTNSKRPGVTSAWPLFCLLSSSSWLS